jgi:hypothetical protein
VAELLDSTGNEKQLNQSNTIVGEEFNSTCAISAHQSISSAISQGESGIYYQVFASVAHIEVVQMQITRTTTTCSGELLLYN